MKTPRQIVKLLDYRLAKASNDFVPQAATLSSQGRWDGIHFEFHQQPKFETLEHKHTMHVIAYGYSKSPGARWLDGKIQQERRQRGDIAIIPAGIDHRCNWNNSAEFGILAVEPALLIQVGQDLVDSDRIELIPQFMNEQDKLIQGIFSTLRDELECHKIGGNLLIDSLKTTLAIHLLRKYCTTKPKVSSYCRTLSKSKLQQINEFIHEHLDDDLKIVKLAEIVQISPCHFIRLFKNTTGQTPHQYILQQRIQQAKFLLQHEEMSISAIAAMVGFCDQSHFNKYFKRIVSLTPRQYMIQSQ